MQNPFNHENYPSNELKRNTFPCSYQSNVTMKYGYIYPAGIWRAIPGATYKFKPILGLNFMPTTFPVQTRQKVYVHYFYGRDRNFWNDYKDFVNGQRPDLVKPYIDESVTKARTGKLLDFLGVPTTLVGNYGSVQETDQITLSLSSNLVLNDSVFVADGVYSSDLFSSLSGKFFDLNRVSDSSSSPDSLFAHKIAFSIGTGFVSLDISYNDTSSPDFLVSVPTSLDGQSIISPTPQSSRSYVSWMAVVSVSNSGNIIGNIYYPEVSEDNHITFEFNYDRNYSYYLLIPHRMNFTTSSGTKYRIWKIANLVYSFSFGVSEVRDITDETSPYWRSDDNRGKNTIKLNASLPRMYETIYNLYYRNPQNNPYMLNGLPEYNKFIPTKDGGVDSNLYELRRRNWEDDFLTTAVQSPQQGIAPLVGLTDRGATLTLTNDDGTVTRYKVSVAENGSLTGVEATDTTSEPVLTKALIDAVSYGISIEDIRNVNAMQKWLELNLRKGYQYKDIIQARWGISISYNELDLPEFIGGFSRDVQLQAVTQTANVNDDITGQLGWQGGRLYVSGEGREFTYYCDEEGYIMCLITTVPVPNYSQLLPKHWIERDLLDSYQPEFNHIGFQPITYKEVCPVQAFQESTENVNVLEHTFGYQRPWYQYFSYVDEVHGQFRTTFKDYLINRVFDVKPELSESFLLVDPEQINEVFNVTDPDDDKIIGAIYHQCEAKLPISLYAQARLE